MQKWDTLPYIPDSFRIEQGAELTIEAGSTLEFRNSNQSIGKGNENAPITPHLLSSRYRGGSNGDGEKDQ
ncbi:MAG: hypothetical protein PHP67_04145 [Sphaerochaeta sp.]|nr:hypothetical protein [Sphaerochaeta sp.]MDD4301079.1 hypothetical protein [Sphaerochaeta sp.]MDD4647392.1 hypothetical protein [Sphaerochaeta sp.]